MRNNLTAQNLRLYVWDRKLTVLHKASSITSNCCLNDTFLIYYAGSLPRVIFGGSSLCGLLNSQHQLNNWGDKFNNLTQRYHMTKSITKGVKHLKTVSFNNYNIDILEHKGEQYMTSKAIAEALGYKRNDSVSYLYRSNKDEFTNEMSRNVKLTSRTKLKYQTRIFNRRGAWLIAMFAKTKKAKEFRKWALDTLENKQEQPQIDMDKLNRYVNKLIQDAKQKASIDATVRAMYEMDLDLAKRLRAGAKR